MSSQELLKKLTGTKFLFDKKLISYLDLVQLLENNGLNTRFIQKPIKDNLEVHSLYIKPDFELAFLVKASGADEYYSAAGYNCINYKEIDLYDVLKLLGYLDVRSQKDVQKEKKPKKYITIIDINKDREYVIKNKDIVYISYAHGELYIQLKNTHIEQFSIAVEKYNEIKETLES